MSALATVVTSVVSQTSPGSGCVAPGGARITALCTANNSLHIPVAYRSILPVLVLTIGALLLLALSAVRPKRSWPGLYPLLTAVIGGASAIASAWQWSDLSTSNGHVSHAAATIGQQVLYDRFS
ncbi:MAG TPA: hypothetical protein VFJ79_01150, partial [Acidimicrobiales bacterium]|nr:hypothetical protein [Acidimicrobiales bacterium]